MRLTPWWCEDDAPAPRAPRCADATCGAEDCPTCYPAQITEDDHDAAEV